MRPVGYAVEQCFTKTRIREHLRPFGKRQIRRQNDCRSFRPFRDDLKKQLGSDLRERHIADFIKDEQIIPRPSAECASEQVMVLRFNQLIDQSGSRRETNPFLLLTRRDTKSGCQMRLTCPRIADQNNRLGSFEITAFRQRVQQRRRHLWRGGKVELLQSLERGNRASLIRRSMVPRIRSSTSACSSAARKLIGV